MLAQVGRLCGGFGLPPTTIVVVRAGQIVVIWVAFGVLVGAWWDPQALNRISDDDLVVFTRNHGNGGDILNLELLAHLLDRV